MLLLSNEPVSLVFPSSLPELAGSLPLLKAEYEEFEAVLGAPVRFVETDPGHGPRWLLRIDPEATSNALALDRDAETLTSTANDADGLMTTFNQLGSLASLGVDRVDDQPEPTMADVVERIRREVAGTFPGFGIRGLEWGAICERHLTDPSTLTFADLQRWIAELGDAHTHVRRMVRTCHPPYTVELTADGATILRVPHWSDAWQAGVRPGMALEIGNPADWLARNGAPPHAHALSAGRRAIALEACDERTIVARDDTGREIAWTEHAVPYTLDNTFAARLLGDDTGYIRLRNWITGIGLEDAFSDAFERFRHCRTLVLDLRGNTGGNLMLASGTRDRFLREQTLLGTIQFTRGDGTLDRPRERRAEPSTACSCWPGDLIVLTDPLTYSAAEDFLLGLQGLPHVTVIGARSGGGSGRPRTIPLYGDVAITISTALTFDRNGTCIEGHGVPVDIAEESA